MTICYLNGEYMPLAQAALPLTDLGVLRGYGVFDYLRTYHGVPFRLDDHIRRFRSSADQIGLHIKESNETLADIVATVLVRQEQQQNTNTNTNNGSNDEDVVEASSSTTTNNTKNKTPQEWAIRIMATGGQSDNNFLPTPGRNTLAVLVEPIIVDALPYHHHHPESGVRIITTRSERERPTVKSTNYITAIMAMQEAVQSGAVEALHVDAHGMVSEGTRTNIFFVLMTRDDNKNNVIVTAPDDILLQGVTRKVMIELIEQDEHLTLSVRPISLDEVMTSATEAFLTSSTKEILPVIAIDGQPIGNGQIGPVTEQCRQLFRAYAWGITAAAAAAAGHTHTSSCSATRIPGVE
jgi:branched-chain amino acid aminotransferase